MKGQVVWGCWVCIFGGIMSRSLLLGFVIKEVLEEETGVFGRFCMLLLGHSRILLAVNRIFRREFVR